MEMQSVSSTYGDESHIISVTDVPRARGRARRYWHMRLMGGPGSSTLAMHSELFLCQFHELGSRHLQGLR